MASTKRRIGSTGEIAHANILGSRTRNSPQKLTQTETEQAKVPTEIEKKKLKEIELAGRKLFISKIQKQIPDWPDNDDVNGYNIYVWSTRKVIFSHHFQYFFCKITM